MKFNDQRSRGPLFSLALSLGSFVFSASAQADAGLIVIDGASPGRAFDGLGGLSAGASSRLLIDYPKAQRDEILDYLFKPNYGASLQICKVEIGGDVNSTDGSEPSHMHTPDDQNYRRGYEWWLMKEAKKRNPAMKFYALEWGVPNWVNPTGQDVWTDNNITYILNFIRHAKSDYGLTIDYVGGWNERGHNAAWYIKFRKALDEAGFQSTKIVADDSFNWDIAKTMQQDPAFTQAVNIIGGHYIDISPKNLDAPNWKVLFESGKPIWNSEMGSQPYDSGAPNLARQVNWGYINDRIVSNTNWATVWSTLPGFPCANDGLMRADQPWSGYYVVGQSIWTFAHTSQFARLGWQYLDNSCGFFDGQPDQGSYVALKSPTGADYSIVIETTNATQPRNVTFQVKGGLPHGRAHVWKTDLSSQNPNDWFMKQSDAQPHDGQFTLTLQPHCIYSLTTTTNQAKGQAKRTIPPSRKFTLPYRDTFAKYHVGETPRLLSDMQGCFEIAPAQGGRQGVCLRQTAVGAPVFWIARGTPFTVVGNSEWEDYSVSSDMLLEGSGWLDLLGRATSRDQGSFAAYHLRLGDDGAWSLMYIDNKMSETLASGVTAARGDQWHTLALKFQGSLITATIDGVLVANKVVGNRVATGMVGYQVSGWQPAEFANLQVLPLPASSVALRANATASSSEQGYEVSRATDDDPSTYWHTQYTPSPAPLPQSITLDLGAVHTVNRLRYLPRQDGNNNGTITKYNIYMSLDGNTFGTPIASGTWESDASLKFADLSLVKTRYIRLEAVEANGGFCSAAEVTACEPNQQGSSNQILSRKQ